MKLLISPTRIGPFRVRLSSAGEQLLVDAAGAQQPVTARAQWQIVLAQRAPASGAAGGVLGEMRRRAAAAGGGGAASRAMFVWLPLSALLVVAVFGLMRLSRGRGTAALPEPFRFLLGGRPSPSRSPRALR
jgi:hypothetical protein